MARYPSNINTVHEFSISPSTREIYIHGYDEEDSGIDHRVAINFIKNLRFLESYNNKPITIHQYSIGGELSAGMAIYDAIKQSNCQFLFLCHGIAASMGSIIPQSVLGKGYRVTQPSCDWLIHDGFIYLEGIHTQAKSNLDYLEVSKSNMYEIYTESCSYGKFFENYSRSKIKAYLKRKIREKTDWCLSGKEAVEYGFADGVLGEEGYENINSILEELK